MTEVMGISLTARQVWITCLILMEVAALSYFVMHAPPLDDGLRRDRLRHPSSPNVGRCLPPRHRDRRFALTQKGDDACVTIDDRAVAIANLVYEAKVLLERLDVVYWVDSGTLLGQYRMHEILPWDMDGDIGILASGFDRLRQTSVPLPDGYVLNVWNSSIYDPHECTPELPARLVETRYGFYLNVFVFHESPTSLGQATADTMDDPAQAKSLGPLASEFWNRCAQCPPVAKKGAKKFVAPAQWILPTRKCVLNDFEVMCPSQPVPYLQHLYGDDFLTPVVW